jgi:hypothetical protein
MGLQADYAIWRKPVNALETAWYVRCAAALPEIGPRFFRIVCIDGVLRDLQSLVEPPD